jgi:hypothetical protein
MTWDKREGLQREELDGERLERKGLKGLSFVLA